MKKSIILTALIVSLSLTSCKTTIPTNDSIIPTLTVMFGGDGLSFNDLTIDDPEFDTKAVYLKRNVEYTILFSGKDDGGVKKITFTTPKENIMEFPEGIPSSWTEGFGTATTRVFTNEGDMSDPRSSMLFSAKFIPKNTPGESSESADLIFKVTDFKNNTLNKTLRLVIGAGPTHIGPR
jgi:hypothetical protein